MGDLKKKKEEALLVLWFKLSLFSGFIYLFFISGEETIAGFSFPLAHKYTSSGRIQTEKTTEEAGG